jgi:hypothetical protein
MVCLQETKMETVSQQIAQETLDQMIDELQFLPAQGTRGGILLGWNSDLVEATDLSLKQYSLSMNIKLKAASPKPCLDSWPTAATGVAEPVFLPSLHPKLGDGGPPGKRLFSVATVMGWD